MRKTDQRITGQRTLSMAAAIAITISSPVFGAGFQVSETSVSGLGRAFAGLGVGGDSVSEMFANPGSLGLRKGTEVEFGIHALSTSADFTNNGSTQTLRSPAGAVTFPTSGTNADGGESAIVPNLYLAGEINSHMRYGIGITAPFGLVTDYNPNWVGRYAAIRSELKIVDFNPAISYRFDNFNNTITMGAGISIIKAEAELTRALFTGPGSPDGLVTLKGDDTTTAWNVGVVGEDEKSRFGIGFRSIASLEVEGDLNIAPLGVTAGAKSNVQLPKTLYLSAMLKKSPKLDLLASIRWTDWSSFKELRFNFDNGLPDSVTEENWKASTTTSFGFNYRKSETVTYRGGIAFDESPVKDEFRTARIPDADRIWLTFGTSVDVTDRVRLDFAYAHIFADSVPISETTNLVATAPGAATDNLNGQYTDTDADIFSVAVALKMGPKK